MPFSWRPGFPGFQSLPVWITIILKHYFPY